MAPSHLIAFLFSPYFALSLPAHNNSVTTHPMLLHNLTHLDKEECIGEEVANCWLADINLDALENAGITLPGGEQLEVVNLFSKSNL